MSNTRNKVVTIAYTTNDGSIITRPTDEDRPIGLVFTFANGPKRTVLLNDVPGDLHTLLALHGLKQKIADSWAGEDAATAVESYDDAVSRLRDGSWFAARKGSGPRTTDLFEVLVEFAVAAGKDAEAAKAHFETLLNGRDADGKLTTAAKDARKAAGANARVEAAIKERVAKRAAEAAKAAKAAAKTAGDDAALFDF